ncbi:MULTISPECIES: hypothetical protein [Pseudomonas]|uniref:hypothetical protein n=1 Tax=Pseudomonas TaxID=286 RepID=UPI00164272E5|nr:hypothetical protein [Pseudomonas proteolytica]
MTREFWDFYRTLCEIAIPEGRTLEQTQNRMLTSEVRFVNFYPLNDIETISPRPQLSITGDQAQPTSGPPRPRNWSGCPMLATSICMTA